MTKSLETPSKIQKTPAKESAMKSRHPKTPKVKQEQDLAGVGPSTGSNLGMTHKKEAIAWRRVCDTVQKYHNKNPETLGDNSEWLVVGFQRAYVASKVFIPKPEGKPKEFKYCFLSGGIISSTVRGNVDLYPRYITEGVDQVNKPDKQFKEINYLIWRDLCRLWPDDKEAKEQQQLLETNLRTKQIHGRATSTPPVSTKLSSTPSPAVKPKYSYHRNKHGGVDTNSDKKSENKLPQREKMPELMEGLLFSIDEESKLKNVLRTETTRWKALESILLHPPHVDVQIAPFPLRNEESSDVEKTKPRDSTSKNDKDIIDDYLDERFPSKALLSEIGSVRSPYSVDEPDYLSFCGRLSKGIPKVIQNASEWKAFHLVSAAVANEIKCGKVDILWLVCTFHETRKMSRQSFLALARAYLHREPLLGTTNPLLLEGFALTYYQTTSFFLDAADEAERKCNVFEPGRETDLILEISKAKTEPDLRNLLKDFKKAIMEPFTSLLRSACSRTRQTDQLIVRTWRTTGFDLRLLLEALRKHNIKPFGELAAYLQQKATSKAF